MRIAVTAMYSTDFQLDVLSNKNQYYTDNVRHFLMN